MFRHFILLPLILVIHISVHYAHSMKLLCCELFLSKFIECVTTTGFVTNYFRLMKGENSLTPALHLVYIKIGKIVMTKL